MQRPTGKTWLTVCLIVSSVLLACGAQSPNSATNCDTDCRHKRYFYDWGLSTGYELQYDTCLMCVLNGCVYFDALPGSCTDQKSPQNFRVTANEASCPNNGKIVEGSAVVGTGDYKDFKQNVWNCK